MDDPRPRRLIGIVSALALAMVLPLVAMPASANGSSSTISDPAGDTLKISPGNTPTPAYLDIIGVAVTRHGGSFEFSMDLAAPVPSQPLLVNGVNQYAWFWALDTDPTTFPTGYPRVPGWGTPGSPVASCTQAAVHHTTTIGASHSRTHDTRAVFIRRQVSSPS